MLAAAIAAALLASNAANAERPVIHVAPEVAVGGETPEQFIMRQAELLAELTAMIPAGVHDSPVRAPLTQADLDNLNVPAPNGDGPLRIGVVKPITGVEVLRGQAFKRGVIEETADGGFVWAMSISSPDAQAIRVHFKNFSLPRNVEMYFFGEGTVVDGPYTDAGRNGDGDFWTRSITSDTGTVLLRSVGPVSDADRRQVRFVVQDVGHIRGRRLRPVEQSHDTWPCSDNAPCVVDVNCVNTGPAAPAEDANARMEWVAGCCINTCTGGLLADTDPSTDVPLFLTANHCFKSSISNLETFFNYTTDSCNGTCPDGRVTGGGNPAPSTVGITVLASGRGGDFTLGQLNEAPPAGAVFLGWTNAPIANSDGAGLYRISNPNFGPQVYSEHVVDVNAGTCRSWPRGERIYSADVVGATMGGSSGSPVVNSAGEVVGQLSGCCGFNCGDVCDAASNSTVDGALAYYYGSVAQFLDPTPCTPSTEVCDNGSDDDCDGDVDCADADCTGDPACEGGGCTLLPAGASCTSNSECCSNSCKGKPGSKTCK